MIRFRTKIKSTLKTYANYFYYLILGALAGTSNYVTRWSQSGNPWHQADFFLVVVSTTAMLIIGRILGGFAIGAISSLFLVGYLSAI